MRYGRGETWAGGEIRAGGEIWAGGEIRAVVIYWLRCGQGVRYGLRYGRSEIWAES